MPDPPVIQLPDTVGSGEIHGDLLVTWSDGYEKDSRINLPALIAWLREHRLDLLE